MMNAADAVNKEVDLIERRKLTAALSYDSW